MNRKTEPKAQICFILIIFTLFFVQTNYSYSETERSKLYDDHVHFLVPLADLDRELQDKVVDEFVAVLDENGIDKIS